MGISMNVLYEYNRYRDVDVQFQKKASSELSRFKVKEFMDTRAFWDVE